MKIISLFVLNIVGAILPQRGASHLPREEITPYQRLVSQLLVNDGLTRLLVFVALSISHNKPAFIA